MRFAEVGNLAPDFTAKNQHGQSITLSALRGGPVVLIFFPFAFTGICTGELRALQQQLVTLHALGARVLAISTDTIYTLRAFADQEGFGFDLLSDHWPHGAIASAYRSFDRRLGCAIRGSFVLDTDGAVVWRVLNSIGEGRDMADHLRALRP